MLYDFIDNSNGYYSLKWLDKEYRSNVNTIFRVKGGLSQEELFIQEAAKAGIVNIRGHSWNPGIRISMYNATPLTGV